MALRRVHDAYGAQWELAIDIMNEPRSRVGDTVATILLKINSEFFSIKTPKTDKETKFKPPIHPINA